MAVYVGTLHRDRLDVDLVMRAAAAAPHMQFTFVGPVALDERDAGALRAQSNVSLLGARPWADVPAYMQHASVLMVPHVVTPFTDSLDPLKAYEYLATGRPVVSTKVAGFRELQYVHVRCVDPDDFVAELQRVADDGDAFPVPELPNWRGQATSFRDALLSARRKTHEPRRRVVYLDHSAELSGAELALPRLLPALHEVEPIVVLAEPGPLQARLDADRITNEVLAMDPKTRAVRRDTVRPSRLPLAALWGSARYVVTLRRRLRQLQPDVVHTNSLKAAVYGSLAGRAAGIPVVCHVRDRIASDYLPRPAVAAVRTLLRHVPDRVDRQLVGNARHGHFQALSHTSGDPRSRATTRAHRAPERHCPVLRRHGRPPCSVEGSGHIPRRHLRRRSPTPTPRRCSSERPCLATLDTNRSYATSSRGSV